ncbi:hypothetical protein [Falsiroseomonas sp. CW058]|uniref:hypothetical protein n=1 Tax=Falsiroseomonas sp. CW058 TaxID=3388664 RepID=UPI003D321673
MPHRLARLGMLLLLAGPALAQPPPAPPGDRLLRPGGREGYVVDPSNGCWAWMSGFPREATDFAYRWTGACPEGGAEGPGRSSFAWREGGTRHEMVHEGTLRAGKAVGRGTLLNLEDDEVRVVETGDFVDDMLVSGRVEVPRLGIVYEGGVLRGRPHGHGRLTVGGRSFEGEWQLGCLGLPGGRWIGFGRPAESCEQQGS